MEDRERNYNIVKLAMIISAILLMVLLAIVTFFLDNNTYEDLDELINVLDQSDFEMYAEDFTDDDDVSWAHRPSLHLGDRINYFEDPKNVLKYTFSFAILGDEENFYYQFAPEIRLQDFPVAAEMDAEQTRLFNLLTRNNSLQNLRILSINGQPLEERYRARLELIYEDGLKKKMIIYLGKNGDDHSHYVQWYIVSSIHDLVDQL